MTSVFIRRGHLDMDTKTQGSALYEDRGRDWSDTSTRQGAPRIACWPPPGLGERHGTDSPSEPLETLPAP